MSNIYRYSGLSIEMNKSPKGDYWCDIKPQGSTKKRERITISALSVSRAMRIAAEQYLRKHPELVKVPEEG